MAAVPYARDASWGLSRRAALASRRLTASTWPAKESRSRAKRAGPRSRSRSAARSQAATAPSTSPAKSHRAAPNSRKACAASRGIAGVARAVASARASRAQSSPSLPRASGLCSSACSTRFRLGAEASSPCQGAQRAVYIADGAPACCDVQGELRPGSIIASGRDAALQDRERQAGLFRRIGHQQHDVAEFRRPRSKNVDGPARNPRRSGGSRAPTDAAVPPRAQVPCRGGVPAGRAAKRVHQPTAAHRRFP